MQPLTDEYRYTEVDFAEDFFAFLDISYVISVQHAIGWVAVWAIQ
jgi:hypothetical protein